MADRKAITEELEILNLEEARASAEDRKIVRASRKNRSEAIEMSLKRDRQNQAFIQAGCKHLKGGKGTSQMYAGNDSNFAVVTHTLSHGETIVVCQRCGKIERPPKLPAKTTPEQRAKYREDVAEYRRWLNMPTDNEPSGTTLFAFTPTDDGLAA